MSDNAAIDPVATSQRIRGVLAPVVTPFKVVPNVNASRNPAARKSKRPVSITIPRGGGNGGLTGPSQITRHGCVKHSSLTFL